MWIVIDLTAGGPDHDSRSDRTECQEMRDQPDPGLGNETAQRRTDQRPG
jgi:hypothetical protein